MQSLSRVKEEILEGTPRQEQGWLWVAKHISEEMPLVSCPTTAYFKISPYWDHTTSYFEGGKGRDNDFLKRIHDITNMTKINYGVWFYFVLLTLSLLVKHEIIYMESACIIKKPAHETMIAISSIIYDTHFQDPLFKW